jgi:hypothetical protein
MALGYDMLLFTKLGGEILFWTFIFLGNGISELKECT